MNQAVSLEFDRRPSAIPYMVRGMMPVTRHTDLAPQICAHWRKHRADPDALAEFRRITGLPAGDAVLPLLYPHTFGFRLAMAILTHPRFPVAIWGVLQTRNHLVQHRPIAAGEPLDFDATVMHGRAVPKGAEFDLRTTVHVEGTLAWETVVTFFTRGRFGEPDPASPLARAPSEFGAPVAEWTIRDTDHRKFGSFTGDSFKGKNSPVKVQELDVGAVGISKGDANADVFNLKNPSDIESTYTAAQAGITIAGGAKGQLARNEKGVVLDLVSKSKGLDLKLGASGFAIKMAK